MSENPSEVTDARTRLLEAAAELLGTEGPSALTARRLATAAGGSTMAVYTHFGGMPALVRAVVSEGFARLAARMGEVPHTDDSVADLYELGVAYRANALANPHLYAVMFGSATLGGFAMDDEMRGIGLYTFDALAAGVQRVLDDGLLRRAPAEDIAGQLWAALHGYVMLELGGYFVPDDAARVLEPLLANLGVGLAAPG